MNASRQRIKSLFPAGEMIRYLIVGGINTVIGTGSYILVLFLLNHWAPATLFAIKLTQAKLAITANIISTPLNITISYFNYKIFVFRTRGNILREWLKAFGVYGASNLIGLLALGALTRFIEVMLHGKTPFGKGTPGYLAGVLMTGVTTVFSYIGHKRITFGGSPGHDEEAAVAEALSDKLDATSQEPAP